jgi:hypothetical protein
MKHNLEGERGVYTQVGVFIDQSRFIKDWVDVRRVRRGIRFVDMLTRSKLGVPSSSLGSTYMPPELLEYNDLVSTTR